MAPSGGMMYLLDRRWRNVFRFLLLPLLGAVVFQGSPTDSAAVAKTLYYFEVNSDCYLGGIQDIPRDQVTYVRVRPTANGLHCLLQFSPQQRGDTLRMWMNSNSYIQNCDVSLILQMTNNPRVQFGCRSKNPPDPLEDPNGKATLNFTRRRVDNRNYDLEVGLQARRTTSPAGTSDSSTGNVGMIVGIIGGVIVFIILIAVLCVFCMRKNRRDADFKVQDTTNSQGLGAYENGKMKAQQREFHDSPSSERKLLSKSNSDCDTEDALKPRSALDRFGPTPARRSDRPTKVEDRQNKQDQSLSKDNQSFDRQQSSPILDALRKNKKFRRSFHDNEADGDERAKRISGSDRSSLSYDSNGVPLPPKLPPVPRSPQRSPSPQRRGEKIAGIFRARPSSSSSEIARQLEGDPVDAGDEELSEFVPSPRKDTKADTRHVLRPDRGERKARPVDRRKTEDEEDSEEEKKRKKRERDKREEERRRKEEDEEIEREEEERRRRKKERERKRQEREEEEEEEERKERRRRRKEKEKESEDERLEGRFKKSASGRRSKGKGPRMGRSKSTGNALEEMEENYQRSRSKSPSSVRSLNFIEDDDDDDDLDSNYMPFKRAGSKTSLYASRSSLYGRRRKNSMGETVSLSSYAYDDLDSRYGDFDRRSLSKQDKHRIFKSTGELEMHGATAQVVRECATQTNSSKSVFVYGKKTLAKSRPVKMYSRGCQTGRTRRDSAGSTRSGRSSHMKKSRSQESLRKRRSRSRNLDESEDSSDDRRSRRSRSRNLDDSYDSDARSHRSRSRSKALDYSDDDDGHPTRKKKHHRSKSRGLEDDDEDDRQSSKGGRTRPKARPRKSTGTASVDLSDSDGGRSAAASSVAPSYVPLSQPNPYGAQYVPVMYPPPSGMTFVPSVAPGGPPMVPGQSRPNPPPPVGPKPPIGPKPKKSKWDQLVEMTEGEKRQRQYDRGDSPTESMLTSVYSHAPKNGAPAANNYYAPPSYTAAQNYPGQANSTISSAYPDSSSMPLSNRGHQPYGYGPSESEI